MKCFVTIDLELSAVGVHSPLRCILEPSGGDDSGKALEWAFEGDPQKALPCGFAGDDIYVAWK